MMKNGFKTSPKNKTEKYNKKYVRKKFLFTSIVKNIHLLIDVILFWDIFHVHVPLRKHKIKCDGRRHW